MTGKERFVDGHILNGHDLLFTLDLQYAVNQQKWVAMRQDGLYLINIERAGWGLDSSRFCGCVQICGFTHSKARIIEDSQPGWNLAMTHGFPMSGMIPHSAPSTLLGYFGAHVWLFC